ncbi:MAG: leucine--tRNA ligase [Thermonema sp.]|uniref:leucine--tRNA ligase n=1 Tax=Thermonema sp. TaxID=2231181 RepID=UPI0021DDB349|nr:leucine--tRNA ligase [Thermonema sp.]GIV40407.1 MAG: leucine--tRNA ligase [Thermonema sp.]
MKGYTPAEIEKKWQQYWDEQQVYRVDEIPGKQKFYVLDMFPYPSGAGLHVGHPLGYIASDIVARYKRHQGYNVLHPMGFDSFGLPAEQYAIQTGQHPAITTEKNIARYKEQLRAIGFSYDWSREVRTSDPKYYKWTQWIFLQLFGSWYNKQTDKAEPIETLIAHFEKQGTQGLNAHCSEDTPQFSAEEWKAFDERKKQEILLDYRLAYLDDMTVNWCPALGMVLSNDEVKDGVSERGGHPVVKKKMRQWALRITAYAERLLEGLERIDWSEAIKEMQRNWIGKSYGAEVNFPIQGKEDMAIKVFTTRIDTIFGVTFLVLAPEHELVESITTEAQRAEVMAYVEEAKNRSERDRMSDVKHVSGVFTGAYVVHPFTGKPIPVWIGDYVLAGYGTGAVMAVPSSDDRDFRFAKHFGLPIVPVIEGTETLENPTEIKHGRLINSDFLNGLDWQEAIEKAIEEVEKRGLGRRRVQYKLRDAVFARQRYWGEPIPIEYRNGIPYALDEKYLPLELPPIDKYLPTEDGDPPLGRAENWVSPNGYPLELNTMPGWAGSSWYFLRYCDPHNEERFASPEAIDYWKNVDLYIGGTEHAVGHLLYARFWTKFLYDRGWIPFDEPFQKLVNQGMIQGRSNFVYRIKNTNTFVSYGLKDQYDTVPMHVDISLVHNDVLDTEAFRRWRPDLADAEFILEDGKYICGYEVEKMSKSRYNVVNPDDIVAEYGADTLRLYEMFLGPLEHSKPWNTHGIDGVYRFLRKVWHLFFDEEGQLIVTDETPTKEELKVLHQTIKRVSEDIERLSLNTPVSSFMVLTNELQRLGCHKRAILEPFVVLLSPYAPHLAEELWHALGHNTSVVDAPYPAYNESYLVEDSFEYPVSINGKMRTKITLPLDMPKEEIEQVVLQNEIVQKWVDGKTPKKIIIVPKRIINIVV